MDRAAQASAPAAIALFVAAGLLLTPQPLELALPAGLSAVAVASALAARRVTGWGLLAGLLVVAAGVVVIGNAEAANLGWFALCVVMGWCILRAGTTQAVVLGLALLLVYLAQALQDPGEVGWGAWVSGTVFTAVVFGLGGRQRQLVDQLREAQAGLTERARAEERNRIAAEMHDLIGHALTVSLMHVSAARLAIEEDPDEARAALAEAERLARSSLQEVRAAVGLMRTASGVSGPLPGAADLLDLVESFRRAGTPVTCHVVGDPSAVPAATGLAAYRIVQESLTNVARHASGAPATVRLDVGADRTRVVVRSAGAPGRLAPDGSGLLGMRERAEALGGHLTAGPHGDGWQVEAVLP